MPARMPGLGRPAGATNHATPIASEARVLLRPPLKWAGGKRWLVPLLRPLWEPYRDRRLVEPLCGGLAVSLGLMPPRALLNDVNPHNINFYRWLRAGLEVEIEMANDSELYYRHRTEFNEVIEQQATSNKQQGVEGTMEPWNHGTRGSRERSQGSKVRRFKGS